VFVDGEGILERPWYISKNKFDALWIDADFEIPKKYTAGKDKLTLRIERAPDAPDWMEYYDRIYSYLE
jgi:hypothetical protein